MRIVVLLTALALLWAPPVRSQSRGNPCWRDAGVHTLYGSTEQTRELQRSVQRTSCKLLGLTWRTKVDPNRRSLLLWDAASQTLFRIHIDPAGPMGGPRWEKWIGATKGRILASDPGGGFRFASYTSGQGRANLPAAAKAFVRHHAPGRFDAGL